MWDAGISFIAEARCGRLCGEQVPRGAISGASFMACTRYGGYLSRDRLRCIGHAPVTGASFGILLSLPSLPLCFMLSCSVGLCDIIYIQAGLCDIIYIQASQANELAPSRDAGVERRAGTLTSQAIITHLYRIVYVIIHPSIITHRPIHIHKWATSRAFYSHISLHISQDFSPSCRQGFALPASIVLATPP